jgi:hypothetical protein
MAIEIGLRTLLLAQASITALAPAQTVGGVSFDAVFLDNAAEGVKPPYVIITQTGHDPYKRLDGTGGTLRKTEVDIDCYASNRPASITLAGAVETFLRDYVGAAGASDTINAVLWENARDDVILTGDGRDQRHYVRSLQFSIQHT